MRSERYWGRIVLYTCFRKNLNLLISSRSAIYNNIELVYLKNQKFGFSDRKSVLQKIPLSTKRISIRRTVRWLWSVQRSEQSLYFLSYGNGILDAREHSRNRIRLRFCKLSRWSLCCRYNILAGSYLGRIDHL